MVSYDFWGLLAELPVLYQMTFLNQLCSQTFVIVIVAPFSWRQSVVCFV